MNDFLFQIFAVLIIAIIVPPVAIYSYLYFTPKTSQPSFTLNDLSLEKEHAEEMLKLRQINGVFENYGSDYADQERINMIKAIVDPYGTFENFENDL